MPGQRADGAGSGLPKAALRGAELAAGGSDSLQGVGFALALNVSFLRVSLLEWFLKVG